MKITDIVMSTPEEVAKMPHFDLMSPPRRCPWYLLPVEWVLSLPETWSTLRHVTKIRMEEFKTPYLILGNHNSFLDFKALTRAIFPHRCTYVVAVDGFIGREKIMRDVGCFGKRKFVNDPVLVRQISYSLKKLKVNCAVYPEARYSLVGTTAILPESLGKMVKLLGVPVVTLINSGHHLRQPLWNQSHRRHVPTETVMTGLLTTDEIQSMSVEEINNQIAKAFAYDDFRYQKDQHIAIKDPHRAEGLQHVLYKCPTCHQEFMMATKGDKLFCKHCGKEYQMDIYGELHAIDGITEFTHIPDWYEWERREVQKEIALGKYKIDVPVIIDSLPSAIGFYRFGPGKLTHGPEGFKLSGLFGGKKFLVTRKVIDNYSVHIEYDYAGKGNFVSFSTTNDTYYIFPQTTPDIVTKIHFGVEELYKAEVAKTQK